MLENEMEDLLWTYPEKFLEPLKPFRRQPRSAVGRADLVFEDRLGRLLIIEVKHGQLKRGAIDQVHDYFGMMKSQFPEKPVEMMVIAQSIPPDRKRALELYNIEFREISERRFRDVAQEMNYVFQSEQESAVSTSGTDVVGAAKVESDEIAVFASSSREQRPELIAVVNAYALNAEPDLRVKDGRAANYRQIVPPEWKTSQLHYEFYQASGTLGAELHLAFRRDPRKVVSIAEFLKPFAGRTVANGERELTWCQERHSGNGCLAASFPLSSAPETVAAAMRDLISMTRAGVSEYLSK